MVQTTGGLTDFSQETLGKIQASCLEGRNASQYMAVYAPTRCFCSSCMTNCCIDCAVRSQVHQGTCLFVHHITWELTFRSKNDENTIKLPHHLSRYNEISCKFYLTRSIWKMLAHSPLQAVAHRITIHLVSLLSRRTPPAHRCRRRRRRQRQRVTEGTAMAP